MKTKYIVLSPDGIPISTARHKSVGLAKEAIARWIKGYVIQGYYADSRGNRIGLDDLPRRCRVQAIGGDE
jgi:hypothetical protein